MVSSAHPLATEAGLEVLERGGNAFDAAVAVAAALNVTEPMMSGMGGYGTILVYSAAEGRARYLDSSGRIPRGVEPDQFRPPTPGWAENRVNAKTITTPGNVNAWASMHEQYGTLEWRELFGPAIRLADEGFALDGRAAGYIESAFDDFAPHAQAFYGREGAPLREGDRLVQSDLANSLRLLSANGPEVFYRGEIGRAIEAAVQEADGFLRMADLEEAVPEWWEPIEIEYRGRRVVTASPPANSFPALIRLGLMSRYEVAALGHNSADYLHRYAESTKHAFWARLRWAGDPDFAPPPLDRLLSPPYWDSVTTSFDPERARDFEPPGVVAGDSHTTHFVVADAEGNVVSATQTLGNSFGSRLMPEGTGIWLNNSLAYSTFEPAGNPMDAHPGRRKLSGDVPLFVYDGDRPWLAVGTPGGHTIAQTIPQIVMNVVDFGMDVQSAISAPRVSFVEPNALVVEDGVPQSVIDELVRRGHEVRVRGPGIGNAHGVTIEWGADGRPVGFEGGADPRGIGVARGN
jgi:gamma-glutamyltranspeptidase/glutathione hydrolase